MSQESLQIDAFKTQLQKQGADYICNTSLPATVASVSFIGPFQGQLVMWSMTLATLEQLRSIDSKKFPEINADLINRPFIEIIRGQGGGLLLNVGLNLAVIDEPVIKKTIIMIRNYKRLSIGRIEFGSMHT